MAEKNVNDFLEKESLGKLMRKYAVPCIISMLVAALYNIVDQIFIANADYLGSFGNAANTVVFPMTVAAIAIAVMIGDGCCTFVSISLGARETANAGRGIGSSVLFVTAISLVLTALYLLFQEPILYAFGAENESIYYTRFAPASADDLGPVRIALLYACRGHPHLCRRCSCSASGLQKPPPPNIKIEKVPMRCNKMLL